MATNDYDELTIQQGVDFHWAERLDHDGLPEIKNIEGWTGRFVVYPGTDRTATPVIASDRSPANATLTIGLQGIEEVSTTLSAAASEGDATITVASATGVAIGQTITVVLNEAAIYRGTITNLAGTTVTLSAALSDDADSGATVQTWDPDYELATVYVHVSKTATAALADWGRGTWDLDITDPYGHRFRYWSGSACYQEGTV